MKKTSPLLAGLFACLLSPMVHANDRDTVLILDASGSMWAQLPEGRSRIEVARDVLSEFMISRDSAAPLGVVAYGHNRRGDCTDIQTISPVQRQNGAALSAQLRTLMPRGKTPLADALRRAAGEIRPDAKSANIILLTDGLETCGGDPCAVAAEIAAKGINIRAHIVGFGLTEGEISQIACVAETTGGLVLAPQNGQDLADALIRTAEPVLRDAETPGAAALNLTITGDSAGFPKAVTFTAQNMETDQEQTLGELDFATASALAVDLTAGEWTLRADAGDLGRGELTVTILAGDNRTIYIPFQGLLPNLILDQIGPYRAGASGIFPARITREGLAVGGADFVLTLLPLDATSLNDRRITWSMQSATFGPRVARLNLPAETGQYRVAYHRYGETNLAAALVTHVITVVDRPEVQIAAPAAITPAAPVPIQITGGGAHADRVEIWRDGALYSWDQSAYLEETFDNAYGPAKVLLAPSEPGNYEIVYVFSEIDGPEAIAARLPLRVGIGASPEETQ